MTWSLSAEQGPLGDGLKRAAGDGEKGWSSTDFHGGG